MEFSVIFSVVCAYIIKGMCGFGNTLVFSTILSFTTNNINISPVDLIIGYPPNIYISWKERHSIKIGSCIPLIIMIITGSVAGVFFLKNGDTGLIKILFGFTIIFIGIENLIRERQKVKKKNSRLVLLLIGILSGVLCGLYGIGAFLAAYMNRTTENQSQFRGNICLVFLVENTFRIFLYSVTGILNVMILQKAVLLLPFMVLGLVIGLALSKSSSEKLIKKAVIILLILSGVSLVINNILP